MKKIKLLHVTIIVLILMIAVGIASRYVVLQPFDNYRSSNSIMVIAPYMYEGTWVFDDATVGLKREPFVSGIPEMIDIMVKDIPNANYGFRLLFSTQPFPNYQFKLTWLRADIMGNWYRCEETKQEGWLCPGLFKYYKDAPKAIYAKAESK